MDDDRKSPLGWHSRGYLPHFDSPERVQHVVLRAFDSLPKHLMDQTSPGNLQRRSEIAELLDHGHGSCPFTKIYAGEQIESALLHFDSIRYRMLTWCVMPNHVHAVVQQIEGFRLGDIVKSWKIFTAKRINQKCETAGPVWAPDYFDRYVRKEEHLVDVLNYVENNPVVAGLVSSPENWRFSSARRRRSASQ